MASFFSWVLHSVCNLLSDAETPQTDSPHTVHTDFAIPSVNLSLITDLSTRYDVEEKRVQIGEGDVVILGIRDTNVLLDQIDPRVFAEDERLPYWAELWPASIALASLCALQPDRFQRATVLEVGCGLGLAGIAAAHCGASVTMTDYEKDALLFARYNATQNLPPDVAAGCVFKLLDWREPQELGRFDLILGADVLYEERNFAPLLDLVGRHLEHNGIAIFTDPGRTIAEQFLPRARARGYTVSSYHHPVNAGKHVVVFEVRS